MKYELYKIANICSMIKGESPTLKTEPGEYPLVVTAEFRRSSSTYQFDEPAVCIPLVSSTGHGDAALHRVHYQDGKFTLANLLVALLPNQAICHPKYLYHLLMAKKDEYLVPLMLGTANVSLKIKDIARVEIPLPPLEEQRRIVARIEELSTAIGEARGLRSESIKGIESLLKSSLLNTFDKHIQSCKWKYEPLKKVAKVARGKFAHRPRNEPRFYGGEIPFIQIGDISKSDKYIKQYHQTLNDDGLKISRQFPSGTVVIAITGATIGVTGILDFDSCFPDSIVGIIPLREKVTPEFLYFAVNYTKKVALEGMTQTTQPNINLKDLEKVTIPLATLAEQHRIVAYLDDLQAKIDSLKRLQAETAAELDALLPSILDKAFKGEL